MYPSKWMSCSDNHWCHLPLYRIVELLVCCQRPALHIPAHVETCICPHCPLNWAGDTFGNLSWGFTLLFAPYNKFTLDSYGIAITHHAKLHGVVVYRPLHQLDMLLSAIMNSSSPFVNIRHLNIHHDKPQATWAGSCSPPAHSAGMSLTSSGRGSRKAHLSALYISMILLFSVRLLTACTSCLTSWSLHIACYTEAPYSSVSQSGPQGPTVGPCFCTLPVDCLVGSTEGGKTWTHCGSLRAGLGNTAL